VFEAEDVADLVRDGRLKVLRVGRAVGRELDGRVDGHVALADEAADGVEEDARAARLLGAVKVTPLLVATVMRLTPSCWTRVSVEETMLKLTLPASAQRCSARRAAPTTSLPALMFAGGELSEEESATVMVVVGQRNWTVAALLSWSV
jgi:hypothetical protein